MIIGGFTHRLQKLAPADAQVQRICGLILAEVDKLSRMVEAVEQFGRMPEPQRRPTDVGVLLTELLEANSDAWTQAHVQVAAEFGPDLPHVPVDERLLRVALQGILDNAREAMPAGGLLTVALHATPTHLQISIADTGGGIRPEDQPFVFDPFFSTKPQNTGMGLTIAHRIIADHQGDIRLNTTPGSGTVVTILLPRWAEV